MRTAVALAVLLGACGAEAQGLGPSLDLRIGGGTPSLATAPTYPTIGCTADAAGGTMTCYGAGAATPHGSPSTTATGASPPWPPNAITYDGATIWTDVALKKCAAVGDSKLASTAAFTSVFVPFTGCTGSNYASSGKSSDDILAQFRDNVKGNGFSTLIIEGGVNDFYVDLVEPEVPIENFKTLIREAQADGISTILWTNVGPSYGYTSWTEAVQTKVETYNAMQKRWAAALRVYRVDEYTVMGDPAAPTQLLAAYDQGDHLHASAAGRTHFGVEMARAAGLSSPGSWSGTAYFKNNSGSGFHYIIGKATAASDEWSLRLNSGTSLVLYTHSGAVSITCGTASGAGFHTVTFGFTYVEGGTHHLDCTLDGTPAVAVNTVADPTTLNTHPFRIGARGASGEYPLDGELGVVTITYGVAP